MTKEIRDMTADEMEARVEELKQNITTNQEVADALWASLRGNDWRDPELAEVKAKWDKINEQIYSDRCDIYKLEMTIPYHRISEKGK
tara:strand:+ start:1867 stop:2127 length:261 start_codon:yes stop_codon:yes gene_type:complete